MKNSNGYAESFARLIKCPTVTESGHEYFDAFHKVLDEEFPLVKDNCERIELGRDVLLYKWSGKHSDRPIVLMAHQDVVPAVGGDWHFPPFGAEIKDGKMYGRGTMDCKNTLFCTMQAVEELIESGFTPEQDVYLSFSDCEETSGPGAEMARDWFKTHGITPDVVVDEGGAIITPIFAKMKKDAAMVGILEKGYADVKFIAKGKGGHSSQPPKNTPVARLGALVNYCEKHDVFKAKTSPASKAMIKGLGDALTPGLRTLARMFGGSALLAKLLPKIAPALGGAMFKTTMVFTMCEGAAAPNIIPQEAWVNLNLRFSPNDSPEKCFKKLEKIAKKFDCEMKVEKCRAASPMVNVDGNGYATFVSALKKTYPDVAVVPYIVFGGTDCRIMQEISTSAIRCTPFRMSMKQLGTMHASDENIDIENIEPCVNFFKNFIESYK